MLISVSHTGNTTGSMFQWADKEHGNEVRKKDLLTAPFHNRLLCHYLQPGAVTSHGGIRSDVCGPHSNHTERFVALGTIYGRGIP